MANIHRIGDYNRNEGNNRQVRPEADRVPLLNAFSRGSNPPIHPRKEHFCHMMMYTCCPTFKFLSFVFIIDCIDTLMYLISILVSILAYKALSTISFFSPDVRALIDLGAKVKDP
jgi:hypothetical protein